MKGIAPPPALYCFVEGQDRDLLGDCQQIIPVHTFVVADFKVLAYPACVDHDTPLWIGFWVEEVVAFRTKVEGGLNFARWNYAVTDTIKSMRTSRQPSHLQTRAGRTDHIDRLMTSHFSDSAARHAA